MDKQFVRLGNLWINNGQGAITNVQLTADGSGQAALVVRFNNGSVTLTGEKSAAMQYWLNDNSFDLLDNTLPESVKSAGPAWGDSSKWDRVQS